MTPRRMGSNLESENWLHVTFDRVVLCFLRGEAHLFGSLTEEQCHLIQEPNLRDAEENTRRRELLGQRRGGLFAGVPPDTLWYEVQYLRNEHLDCLLVMREPNWNSPADRNELGNVAGRRQVSLRSAQKNWKEGRIVEFYQTEPEQWQSPILWGHSKGGPCTILEGTHRLVWYYSQAIAHPNFKIAAYVGLSESRCHWHMPDWFGQP